MLRDGPSDGALEFDWKGPIRTMVPKIQTLSVSSSQRSILCRISTYDPESLRDLDRIVQTCAKDLGISHAIMPDERSVIASGTQRIQLRIPLSLALDCQPVWKLASHVAGFCPWVQVSAEIENPKPDYPPIPGKEAPREHPSASE